MRLLAAAAAVLIPVSSFALSMDQINCWTGTGSLQAAMVVDFSDEAGNPAAFVWGYNFDGAATGFDMLNAITSDPASGLTMTYETGSYGPMVQTINYLSYEIDDQDGNNMGYSLGSSISETLEGWTSSGTGASGRVLVDNSWDAWTEGSWNTTTWVFSPVATTDPIPVQAVPEPASIALILAGAVALLKLRRK